jgi:hypothetical protein
MKHVTGGASYKKCENLRTITSLLRSFEDSLFLHHINQDPWNAYNLSTNDVCKSMSLIIMDTLKAQPLYQASMSWKITSLSSAIHSRNFSLEFHSIIF